MNNMSYQEITIDNNLINCIRPGEAGNVVEKIMPCGKKYPTKGKKKAKKKIKK